MPLLAVFLIFQERYSSDSSDSSNSDSSEGSNSDMFKQNNFTHWQQVQFLKGSVLHSRDVSAKK